MELLKTILMYIGLMVAFAAALYLMGFVFCRIYAKRKKKKGKKYVTYTKRWLTFILINGVIWVYLSYVLAFMDKAQIAETLSTQAVISIIATMIGYFAKSAFEKKIGKEKEDYENQLETETDIA